MASVFDAAQFVLEGLRVDLHEWKRSPDLRDKVQRCATRRESQMGQEASAVSSVPPFRFCPLATAPATCVVFWEASPSRDNGGDVARRTSAECSVSRGAGGERTTPMANAPSNSLAPKPKGRSETPTKTSRVAEAVEPSPALSHSTSVPCSSAEPSRWETALRRLSPAAQQLHADMAERGRTAMAVEVQTTSLWQRRENCPRGAEQRRAVRDYLYRMNILSSMDFAIEKEESEGAVDVSAAFADAVMNGTALCQLVSTLLLEGDEPLRRDAVPCRCPRTLGEVRVNYAQALSALRGAPPAAQGHMPSSTWSILPEDVFFKSTPTALLELLVHLISTYLPSPEELPAWKRPMCWQPSADRAAFSLLSPLKLSAAEAECCAFLHTCGVFPDAALYRLPGPECLLPSPLAAPFMADWKTYVARIDAPPCLLLPSVWPFLCNGVLLVLLARRSGAEAAACAVEPASRGTFFDNPRTVSCCMANISAAFRIFRAVSVHQSSLQFFTAESAAAVLRGDRLHIVTLLLQLRAELEGTPRRTPSSLLLPPSRSARRKKSPAAARDDEPPHQAALAGASAATPSFQQTPTAAHSRSSFAASPPTSLTLRRLEPATVAKNVARRHSTASDSGSAAPSRSPSVHFDPGLGLDNKSNSAPSSKQQETRRALRSEDNAVSQWLRCLVGPGFRYTAIDQSFSFDARHFALSQPCPIFSDGVLLAHVIGLLERRRCDYLDCVQPATKKAAKLFNVRRCLAFLRSSAGVVWELSLLDEALVNGSAEGVLSLLRALRGHYGLARNSNLLCSEEMVMATASAA